MSTETNRQTALAFLEALQNEGFAGLKPYMKEGFKWWVPGSGEVQDYIEGVLKKIDAHLKQPIRMDVIGVTAEGDRVAVEAQSYGELTNGRVYKNTYHFLFEFSDGKVAVLKEYNNTQHAATTWGDILA